MGGNSLLLDAERETPPIAGFDFYAADGWAYLRAIIGILLLGAESNCVDLSSY